MPAMLKALARKLGMLQHDFSGGVHPEMHKVSAGSAIEDFAIAELHILPMKQHIGEACSPLVAVGDRVLRGQKIARSEGYVSVPVHAPTSGRVVRIEEHPIAHPSGLGMPSIFIESDGEDAADGSLEPIADWINRDPAVLRERARMAGLAGLGGAVFPTFIKLVQDKRFPIETVIINGIECEPWLTNDHRLMLEHADEIVQGLGVIMHMVGAEAGLIAIEDNKPDAVETMRVALAASDIADKAQVVLLPTRYPQGSEKQLIHTLTGREVPAGKLPMHIGVLCQNAATTRALCHAVLEGRPLTERVVTVSGDAVPTPANLRVRLGTPMRSLLTRQGLESLDGLHLIHGGPMMGERLHNIDVPVVKSTTGVLAFSQDAMSSAHTIEQPCIRCGHCGEACPVSLVPNLLADFCRADHFEKAEVYDLFDCIECGSCSYVCPSNIPLVHYFRYGKGQVAQSRREQSFAEASRDRSSARDARIEREKAEKAARRSKVRQSHAPEPAVADAAEQKPAASATESSAASASAAAQGGAGSGESEQ